MWRCLPLVGLTYVRICMEIYCLRSGRGVNYPRVLDYPALPDIAAYLVFTHSTRTQPLVWGWPKKWTWYSILCPFPRLSFFDLGWDQTILGQQGWPSIWDQIRCPALKVEELFGTSTFRAAFFAWPFVILSPSNRSVFLCDDDKAFLGLILTGCFFFEEVDGAFLKKENSVPWVVLISRQIHHVQPACRFEGKPRPTRFPRIDSWTIPRSTMKVLKTVMSDVRSSYSIFWWGALSQFALL